LQTISVSTMANAQVRVKFVENIRGGVSLVHDYYRYVVKSKRDDTIYWRCSVRSCPARIRTVNNVPVAPNSEHNHNADPGKIVASQIMTNVKKRCREEIKPVPQIYNEELSKLRTPDWDDIDADVAEKLPTYQSCHSSLYRQRSKTLPKLPKTTNEIDLQGEWTRTTAGERFLLVNDGDQEKIVIFSTDKNLQLLADNSTIFGDGTFYTCPSLFTQLYTLHGNVDGQMYPLVFCLLPSKSQAVYNRMFSLVKTACIDRNIELNPTTLFADYETAVHNAAKSVFDRIVIKGCFFHYGQCIWRRVQSCGLQVAYRDNDAVTQLVRRAAVLPLVPDDSIEDVWFNALEDIGNADIDQHQMIQITTFTDYVTTNWVETNRHIWNHYETRGPRTTNHLEGWHAKIKRQIQQSHPNVFSLIGHLKQVQSVNEVTMIQLAAGGPPPPKRRKYRQLETRLENLKQRLENRDIDILHYADAASHLVHLG